QEACYLRPQTCHNRARREEGRVIRPMLHDMRIVPKKPLRPRPPVAETISKSYLESFIAYVAGECHLAENSVAAYRRDTKRFFQWLETPRRKGDSPIFADTKIGTVPLTALSVRDLADYVGWLHGLKLSPTSI